MFDSISSVPIVSSFMYPTVSNRERGKDVSLGGVWVNDTSKGLDYQGWLFFTEDGVIKCKPIGENRVHNILNVSGVQDIAGTFDRNMNPCIAYRVGNESYYYYFDTLTLSYITLPIRNCRSFALTHDDSRELSSAISDVILTWIANDNTLYYALQRERYNVNHIVQTSEKIQPNDTIQTFGMNKLYRLQWDIGNNRNRNPINYT